MVKLKSVLAGIIVLCILVFMIATFFSYLKNNDECRSAAGTGTIRYCVSDVTYKPVSGAKVTLWNYGYDETNKKYGNMGIAEVPDNPTITGSGGQPFYSFNNVPYGDYNITVEKDSCIWSRVVRVTNIDYGIVAEIIIDYDDYATIPPETNLSNNTIYGFVKDKNGVRLPNANVTIAVLGNNTGDMYGQTIGKTQTLSNDSGYAGFYSFEGLTVGNYNLIFEKDGKSINLNCGIYENNSSIRLLAMFGN